ncbi:MAG: segregation/condensation protein A [Acidimicrobiia bacterium]|nr:segregation/condensation protein A [Acidimicrobiia bacterium]
MGYEVRTSVFEGPFDLLLHLILRQEVDLWEVSLAPIIDEYLAELERMHALDLELATEFLLIAATLIELKTRRLLPGQSDLELDEELLRFEERDLLLARLLECKTFKDAAATVQNLMSRAALSVARLAGPEEPFRSLVPDPLERVRPQALRDAARRALAPRPQEVVDTDHIAPIRVSVAEAIVAVLERVPAGRTVQFRDLGSAADTKLDVIVRFLAVLELYKQGLIDIEQIENFGSLTLRRLVTGEFALDEASVADWDEPATPPSGQRT